MIIDVHSHFYPKPYLERLTELNRGDASAWGRFAGQTLRDTVTQHDRYFEVEPHLAEMDEAGVDMEALSLSIPYPYFDDEGDTVALTRLANDELGYFIPKRQWDEKAPYCYGLMKAQYGEVNSVGPEAAPIICGAFEKLVRGK